MVYNIIVNTKAYKRKSKSLVRDRVLKNTTDSGTQLYINAERIKSPTSVIHTENKRIPWNVDSEQYVTLSGNSCSTNRTLHTQNMHKHAHTQKGNEYFGLHL